MRRAARAGTAAGRAARLGMTQAVMLAWAGAPAGRRRGSPEGGGRPSPMPVASGWPTARRELLMSPGMPVAAPAVPPASLQRLNRAHLQHLQLQLWEGPTPACTAMASAPVSGSSSSGNSRQVCLAHTTVAQNSTRLSTISSCRMYLMQRDPCRDFGSPAQKALPSPTRSPALMMMTPPLASLDLDTRTWPPQHPPPASPQGLLVPSSLRRLLLQRLLLQHLSPPSLSPRSPTALRQVQQTVWGMKQRRT
mmetsp:Transcript_22545/g.62288  ORF Transcript_22545/g.62288 Transcript_22545/m.62288 type:complete len:250 (+) Transcript_22545:1492-2241(+)